MFECLDDRNESPPKIKCIYLMQNGNPDQTFQYRLIKPLTKSDIIEIVEKKWSSDRYKNIRIFSCDAVQYYDEDLLYLKDGDRFFISRGEDFDSNRNFGEYQILKTLGQGGFGSVSLALNRITNEYAAIKVVKTNKLSTSSCIDMIFKEAQNLKSLSHPNIVKILNCYALKNMKFVVVMEYLQGGQLKQLLKKKKKFSEQEARFYFKQIINAISFCHQEGIVHRDLKLENILLTQDFKTVKVADFGISGMADRFNPQLDWGTLKFMPPEILSKKQKNNSFAGDVWACGIILFYMVQGFLPFTGDSSAIITKKIIEDDLIFTENCQLSDNCRALIEKLLNKDPKKRLTMNQVLQNHWVLRGAEQFVLKNSSKKLVIHQLKKKEISLKRKSLNNNSVQIPRRLERQKHKIIEQLNIYRKTNGKFFRSQFKILPEIGSNSKLKANKQMGRKDIFASSGDVNLESSTRNSRILIQNLDNEIVHCKSPVFPKKYLFKQNSLM